jgi:HAD superfamily hydrolase (TIGR01549 family)
MNTFIFDLDGTLLPMPSQQKFLEAYMKAVSGKVIKHGYEPQTLIKALMAGTEMMIKNDGSMTNEERFWLVFCEQLGEKARELEEVFEDFYRNEFALAKIATATHPLANTCVKLLKKKGYRVVLATNPLFPRIATLTRMLWAGLAPEEFDLITTYENSTYSKPNLEYYKEVLAGIGKEPEECIMVGNDVREDMCAARLGMDTFLLKDCLICPEGEDISGFQQGNFNDLHQMIMELPSIII